MTGYYAMQIYILFERACYLHIQGPRSPKIILLGFLGPCRYSMRLESLLTYLSEPEISHAEILH
jgi:hypothetical protein